MKSQKVIQTGVVYRKATIERSAENEERIITASISSATPYERSWGTEILSHDQNHVNLDRVKQGAVPFLADHDQTKLIGKVKTVKLTGNRAIATIKLSNSTIANEVYEDIKSGIRTEISIGYTINAMEEIERATGENCYLVTDWELYEVSSVACPADATVGIGRSHEMNSHYSKIMGKSTMENNTETRQEDQNVNNRMNEVNDILSMGADHGFTREATQFIKDGKSASEFGKFVLEKLGNNVKPVATGGGSFNRGFFEPASKTPIIDTVIAQIPGQQSRETEYVINKGKETARQKGLKARGIMLDIGDINPVTRTLSASGSAGNTIQTDVLNAQFVDLLRNAALVSKLGATIINGAQGNIVIPKQTGSAEGQWLAEGGSVTESDQTFGQVTLSPKTVSARTSISRQALLQSSIDLESIIQKDLASALGLAIDKAAISGTGADYQPRGILNTTGIGTVVGGDNGLVPAWSHIVNLQTELSSQNALLGNLAFLTNGKMIGKLMQTEKAANTAEFIVKDLPDAESMTKIGGALCGVSNQVPSNLTKGTSDSVCSAIIYGNWADLIIAQWGALDIIVDPYTDSNKGQLNITAFLTIDIAVRHAESFAVMMDALTA